MKNILIVLLAILVMFVVMSCRAVKILQTTKDTSRHSVEQITDTVERIVVDSASLKMWLECDSVGRVRLARLKSDNTRLTALVTNLGDNILSIGAQSTTTEKVRTHIVRDTVREVFKVEVPVFTSMPSTTPYDRNHVSWWQNILIWLGAFYALRTAIKITFNWHRITFKTLLNLL